MTNWDVHRAHAKGLKSMDQSYGAVVYAEREGTRLYLLVLHSGGAHWDFPKGRSLPSEMPDATILREVCEESGCKVQLLADYEDSIEYILPRGGAKRVRFRLAWLIKPDYVPLPNQEIRGIGWFTFEEALRTVTYENSRQVLVRAEAFLQRQDTCVPPSGRSLSVGEEP